MASTLENLVFEISVGKGKSLGKVDTKQKTWKSFKRMFHRDAILVDNITFGRYCALSDDEKLQKKMSPGNWMPAIFKDGKRKKANQLGRTGIALDLDYVELEQLEAIRAGDVPASRFACFMHTTRSHCPEKPRVRMFFPVSRQMTLDESDAITRYLSSMLHEDPEVGIEIPDIVSMKSNQVMYLPSICRDQEYWTQEIDGELLDVDDFLGARPNWTDHATLPYQDRETRRALDRDRVFELPTEKEGIIGAFCRAYDIHEAIAEFLPDEYVPGDDDGQFPRYTYTRGGSSNGAIVYDDGLVIHSHHGSDPVETANAFDMVRIHMFGHLDDAAHGNTSIGNMPSFKAMSDFARKQEAVQAEMRVDLIPDDEWDDDEDAENDDDPLVHWDEDEADGILGDLAGGNTDRGDDDDLDDLLGGGDEDDDIDDLLGGGDEDDDDIDDLLGGSPEKPKDKKKKPEQGEPKTQKNWDSMLILDKQGAIEKSLHNCKTIVMNSKKIAPCIGLNTLENSPYLLKPLRFPRANISQTEIEADGEGRTAADGRRWTDNDTAALMCGLAAPTRMGGYQTEFTKQQVEQALMQAADANRFNPFLRKVQRVEWDGVPRLDTFFHDWFLAEDNPYHTELARVWFVAAIARQYELGTKFDLVPILGGKQGGSKTWVITRLGLGYGGALSGNFENTQKMVESTRGKVVVEVPELRGMSKSEIEDIKQYFTSTKDTVRLAYRRNEEDLARRCVYMGTTNNDQYLKDEENRRFCPVKVGVSRDNWLDRAGFLENLMQFWAEAHHLYLEMRKEKPHGELFLDLTSREANEIARELQANSREVQAHEPVAEVIENWLEERLTFAEVEAQNAGNPDLVFDDEEERKERWVRVCVTTSMIREALSDHPVIRELRGAHADKTIAQALKSLGNWESAGPCRRAGKKARWYERKGYASESLFALEKAEESVEDLLG